MANKNRIRDGQSPNSSPTPGWLTFFFVFKFITKIKTHTRRLFRKRAIFRKSNSENTLTNNKNDKVQGKSSIVQIQSPFRDQNHAGFNFQGSLDKGEGGGYDPTTINNMANQSITRQLAFGQSTPTNAAEKSSDFYNGQFANSLAKILSAVILAAVLILILFKLTNIMP
uniref:Uncharacterized protein n=1 Tax=Romanomermis culicivorax TaxID=13658 RepID=A0A915LAR6_ROMCU